MVSWLPSLAELANVRSIARNIYQRRELIRILTWRDFQSRFRGSAGGLFWSIIQPLFMMIVYTIVFSTFLKIRFGSSDSPYVFAVYLLCGLLPWNAFSEGLLLSTNLIRQNQNLVKRVVFPLEVLPINISLVALLQQGIGMILLIPLTVIVAGQVYWTLLLIPLVMVIQVLFQTGVNWLWTSFSVYIPDLRQFTTMLVTILMFMTPIFYPEDMIPAQARFIVNINPMAMIIGLYRSLMLEGQPPDPGRLIAASIISILTFLVGYFWYMRHKKHFADFL